MQPSQQRGLDLPFHDPPHDSKDDAELKFLDPLLAPTGRHVVAQVVRPGLGGLEEPEPQRGDMKLGGASPLRWSRRRGARAPVFHVAPSGLALLAR